MKILTGSRSGAGGIQFFSSLGLIAGDPFIVVSGSTILIDIDTPALGFTSISGIVKPNGLTDAHTLTTLGIDVLDGGVLEYGTEAAPCTGPAIICNGPYAALQNITINGFETPTTANAANRGIMVWPGGRADLWGTYPSTIYTTIAAPAGITTNLTLAVSPGWANGDAVLVAPTDFQDYQNVEQFTLNGGTSGTSATLNTALLVARYGSLQYPTDTGLATTPGTFSTMKASAGVPTVLDQRARVANLTRGLNISAPLDSDWTDKGHGVNIMAMATNGTNQGILRMGGVAIRRGGQRGAIGRYPIHWHMQSYHGTTGAFTANSVGCAKHCVVWDSENRAYTIHGTCGVTLSDNISYNVIGHAYFLEDGSEQNNVITGNMAFKTTVPTNSQALPAISTISGTGALVTIGFLSVHGLYTGQTIEVYSSSVAGYNVYRVPCAVVNSTTITYAATGTGVQSGATAYKNNNLIKVHDVHASGFWITNLGNTITGNYGAGSTGGNGMWVSLSRTCFGLSAVCTTIIPQNVLPLSASSFADFTGHSNLGFGLQHSQRVSDEAGNVDSADKYPQAAPFSFTSSAHKLWKNSSGGYNNTTNQPIYIGWTVADNEKNHWSGVTNPGGVSFDHLGIGQSLNNTHTFALTNFESDANFCPQHAFVPYHGTVTFTNCSWFNYVYAACTGRFQNDRYGGGGVTQGGMDYYDVGVIDRTTGLNTGFKIFNAHPGAMVWPHHLANPLYTIDNPSANQNFRTSISCVWYDIDGKWGTAGKHMLPFSYGLGVVDDYFLSGATNVADGPTTGTVMCKTTDTHFAGVGQNDVGCWTLQFTGVPVNDNLTNVGTATLGAFNPLTITRQNTATGVTIGTPFAVKRGDTAPSLGNYRQFPMQIGGRFDLDFSETSPVTISLASPGVVTYTNGASHGMVGNEAISFSTTGVIPNGITVGTIYYVLVAGLTRNTFRFAATPAGAAINTSGGSGTHSYTYRIDYPTSLMLFDICSAVTSLGDFMLMGIPWANGAASPRVCFGSGFGTAAGGEPVAGIGLFQYGTASTRNTFATAADVTANRAIICSSAGVTSVADVLADTTGVKFWRDTTNNRVWVRFTNRNTVGGILTGNGVVYGIDVKTVVVKV